MPSLRNLEEDPLEIALDGVYYVLLRHMGRDWRLASVNPLWREELATLPPRPDERALASAREKGVWLAPVKAPESLALACCGLGSAWPGMGRELYANFPVAREAIDNLARSSDWDVLSLLAETDSEKLNNIRWQIPYLFLLEYAQWALLASLGLKPSLVCGHSIGELVALGVAKVYDARSAWYLFNARAAHIAALEAKSGRQTGMLAVPADEAEIREILAAYPRLKIANANAPSQFVLGGPRDELMDARKTLRKKRVPAFALPLGIAFHNPAMAVLRDLAYRRLVALDMRPPKIPVISCVDAKPYPSDKTSICREITRLDENMVDWISCCQAIDRDWNIRNWLELGPQEILGGLIRENVADAKCLAADRKGREAAAMRELCCQLFTDGHLSLEQIISQSHSRNNAEAPVELRASANEPPAAAIIDQDGEIVLKLLAETCGRDLTEADLHLDLRRDLALRSSSFPRLAQEAEVRLGRPIELENLPQIATVGDLIQFLTGTAPDPRAAERAESADEEISGPGSVERLLLKDGRLVPAPFDPLAPNPAFARGDAVCVIAGDPDFAPNFWGALGALGVRALVPWSQTELRAEAMGGGETIALDCANLPDPEQLEKALEKFVEANSPPAAVVFISPPIGEDEIAKTADSLNRLFKRAPGYLRDPARIIVLQQFSDAVEIAERIRFLESLEIPQGSRAVVYDESAADKPFEMSGELADPLILEALRGSGARVLWRATDDSPPRFCPASELYTTVFPAFDAGKGQWESQFSRFASPDLASRGGGFNPFADPLFPREPWTPPGALVANLLLAANLSSPWLVPHGLSDARLIHFPALPESVTRVLHYSCRDRGWLFQDDRLARLCQTKATVETIRANGRITGESVAVAEGLALMAASGSRPAPLWPPEEFGSGSPADLNPFYELLGFGPPWRLLKNFEICGNAGEDGKKRFAAGLEAPGAVAGGENWRYAGIRLMTDATFTAALAVLAGATDASRANLTGWSPPAIGFCRFNFQESAPAQSLRLQLELSWLEQNMARFDAQIIDEKNGVLFTLNHLEFDRKDSVPGD